MEQFKLVFITASIIKTNFWLKRIGKWNKALIFQKISLSLPSSPHIAIHLLNIHLASYYFNVYCLSLLLSFFLPIYTHEHCNAFLKNFTMKRLGIRRRKWIIVWCTTSYVKNISLKSIRGEIALNGNEMSLGFRVDL